MLTFPNGHFITEQSSVGSTRERPIPYPCHKYHVIDISCPTVTFDRRISPETDQNIFSVMRNIALFGLALISSVSSFFVIEDYPDYSLSSIPSSPGHFNQQAVK